ncbi:TPA: helix-turn-helix domain-containing protein [Streptococcus suis]
MKKNRLKTLRKEKGDNQSVIASLLGVNVKTVSRWEKGENEIKLAQANMLANHFGVSVEYLLGYSDFRTVKDEFENEIKKQDKFYPDYGGDSDTPIEPYTALAIATVGKEFKTLIQEKVLALSNGNVVKAGKYVNALNKLPSNLQMTTVRYLLLTNSMQETVSELLAGLLKTNNNND